MRLGGGGAGLVPMCFVPPNLHCGLVTRAVRHRVEFSAPFFLFLLFFLSALNLSAHALRLCMRHAR